MLGMDGVGRIAYIMWLIEIANVFSCFGLPSSLTRYLAELHGQKDTENALRFGHWVFLRYLTLSLIGSVIVGILFFCSSHYVGAEAMLPVVMLLFLANGLQSINQADLAGRQCFALLARINGVATVALVIGVSIGSYYHGVAGALYGYLAGALFPAAFSLTMLRGISLRQKIDIELRRRVWKFTFNTWLAMIVSAFVWSRMEIYFLGRYWNPHEVAIFTVGLTFAVMVQQVTTLFSGSFMAHFSQLLGSGNNALIQRHYESATRLAAFAVIPIAFGGAAIMPVLLPLLFGQQFAPAVPSAMVLTVTAAMAFSLIGSSLIYAKERSDFIALGGVVGAILSVSAGFLIVSKWGAWGAVWSRLVVQGSMIALGTWFIVTKLHFSYPFKSLVSTVIAAGLCGLSAWCIIHMLPNPYTAICVAIPLGIIVYLLGIKFFGVLRPEDVHHLRRIAGQFPVRVHNIINLVLDAMVGT